MNAFVFVLLMLVVSGAFLVRIVAILARRKDSDKFGVDETKIMQELHQGLLRMEQRVEALETLMMHEKRSETREERLEREFRDLEK